MMDWADFSLTCFIAAGPGLALMKVGKIVDVGLGEHKIKSLKFKWGLESHWMSLAQQSWADLYVSSASTVELFLSRLFGPKAFSIRSVFRFLLFSVLLNVFLISIHLALALGVKALRGTNGVHVLAGMMVSFVVINSVLDIFAYLITRAILKNPPRSGLKILACLLSVVAVAWITVLLSLSIGSALAFIPMFDHFDFGVFERIIIPLISGWIHVGLLNPFHANVSLNGLSLGYSALGALPSISILSCVLALMVFLKFFAQFFRKTLCFCFGRVLDKKDGLFENLGMYGSMVFSLFYLGVKFFAWLLS